jgi:hypothetical protein
MKNIRRMQHVVIVLLIPTVLLAADLIGTWKGPMQPGGDAVFELKAEKGAITGNMLGRDGKSYPVTGKLDGDSVSMNVAFERRASPSSCS